MKKAYRRIKPAVLLLLIVCVITTSSITVFAHSLSEWATIYSLQNAITYRFALGNEKRHIDGNKVYYHFKNNSTKTVYQEAFETGITLWDGLITGEETILQFNAHTTVEYVTDYVPPDTYGQTWRADIGSNDFHIRRHTVTKDAMIIFYPSGAYSKNVIAAHEIGHLWGIMDLTDSAAAPFISTETIYCGISDDTPASPTRNDRNAMRIATEDYWFETDSVWCYHVRINNTYVRIPRGDVNFSYSITAADARLILRYVTELEVFTDDQIKLADVDGDGDITAADARHVLRYASNLITKFPADH